MRIVYCPRCRRPVTITITGTGTVDNLAGCNGHVMTLGGLACPTPPPSTGAEVAR
jgi:hypothetical protein